MKKKILLPAGIALAALAVLAAIALLPFLSMLMGSGGAAGSYAQVVNLNWELDLPAEATRLYETDSGPSFHGDGERYHVLSYSSSPEAALEQQTVRLAVFPEEAAELLERLEVPEAQRPDLADCRWFTAEDPDDVRNRLYLGLDGGSLTLYVIESFF